MAEPIFRPAGTLMPTAERAWWAVAVDADGPYNPISGSMSIHAGGGLKAIASLHELDVSGIRMDDHAHVQQVTDSQGRTWHVRMYCGWLCVAFRDRTDEEVDNYIEQSMDCLNRHIRSSAMNGLWSVSDGLFQTFDALRPERHMPRAERRRLKRRLTDLSNALGQLLCVRMTGREVRQLCQEAGIRVHGPDHQRWLDENYQ